MTAELQKLEAKRASGADGSAPLRAELRRLEAAGAEAQRLAAAKQQLLDKIEQELANLQVGAVLLVMCRWQRAAAACMQWRGFGAAGRRQAIAGVACVASVPCLTRHPTHPPTRLLPTRPPAHLAHPPARPPALQARIADTEAELGTELLGQLGPEEQAEVRQLQPQVSKLQVRWVVCSVCSGQGRVGWLVGWLVQSGGALVRKAEECRWSASTGAGPATVHCSACLQPTAALPAWPLPLPCSTHPLTTHPLTWEQEELEAVHAQQLEVEAAAQALEAELTANLREQQRDLQDRLAGASSTVDAASLEAARRELGAAQAAVGEVAQREKALEADSETAGRQAKELGAERDKLRAAAQQEDQSIQVCGWVVACDV